MTTPERLKRRQMIEGSVLILLAIFTVCQAIYFNIQANDQRDCLRQNVAALNKSYSARANLVTRDSAVKTKVITTIASAKTSEQVRKALDTFIADQHEIDMARKSHPVPPFPPGSCSD